MSMNGYGSGNDFGFSVALVNHRSEDDVSNKPLPLSVVVGLTWSIHYIYYFG